MSGFASLAALVLAATLLAAAFAKFRDLAGNETAFAELGLPAPALLAWLVPSVEAAIAVGLLLIPALGALAAFGLLALFTALLVSLIRTGSGLSCRCFGGVSDRPVTWLHVARNGLMLGLAALASTLPICFGCYLWKV